MRSYLVRKLAGYMRNRMPRAYKLLAGYKWLRRKLTTKDIRYSNRYSKAGLSAYLAREAVRNLDKTNPNVLFVGDTKTTYSVQRYLRKNKIFIRMHVCKNIKVPITQHDLDHLSEFISSTSMPSVVVIGYHRNRDVQKLVSYFTSANSLRAIPVIFKIHESDEYPLLPEYDNLSGRQFITTIFDNGIFEKVYRESLSRVRLKCQVRDAFDLYQFLLQSLYIEGDILEIGSYEGHSGFLMAKILEEYGVKKRIYLCDMFSSFPTEITGVDYFWNDTHHVDFEQVKSLFRDLPYVHLVKGDIRQTFAEIRAKSFSFIYVDCDSYGATKFVCERGFPRLSVGGFMLFEDYGHEPLVGVRTAVDDFFKNRNDVVNYFSFFSGLQVFLKIV